MKLKKILLITFTTLMLNPLVAFAIEPTEIGIYISVDNDLVTKNKGKEAWETVATTMIEEANEIYITSKVHIKLVLSHIDFRDMMNDDKNSSRLLDNLSNQRTGFESIFKQEDIHGADYTIALSEINNGCGRAHLGSNSTIIESSTYARGVVDPTCGVSTFIHELGHTMGLAHGDQVASVYNNPSERDALTSYAKGWGFRVVDENKGTNTSLLDQTYQDGEFGTIMIGNHLWNWTAYKSNIKIPIFSSPTASYEGICGQKETRLCGDTTNGDAVKTLNDNRLTYAGHQERDADHLTYADSKLTNCLKSGYSDREVSEVNSLDCSDKDIGSIQGIEQLTSLAIIDLSHNKLINLSYLEKFSANTIESIDLSGNDTALCHQLERLENKFGGTLTKPERCFNAAVLIPILMPIL